jgi:hypothetical protein
MISYRANLFESLQKQVPVKFTTGDIIYIPNKEIGVYYNENRMFVLDSVFDNRRHSIQNLLPGTIDSRINCPKVASNINQNYGFHFTNLVVKYNLHGKNVDTNIQRLKEMAKDFENENFEA